MSDRDELVEPWYVKEIKSLQERLSTKLRPAEHSALCTAIAALSAQPQQEPVARVKRNSGCSGREFIGESLEFRDLPVGTKLYAAPPSGVRDADGVVVPREMPESFAQWFESQVPPRTVISNPRWWAPKIYRALLAAAKEPRK